MMRPANFVRSLKSLGLRSYCRRVAKICGDLDDPSKKKEYFNRQQLKEFGKYVSECLPLCIQKVQLSYGGELEIMVVPDSILCTLQFLKDHHNCQFEILNDVTSIDVPSREYRFELNYNLLSLRFNTRLRVSIA